MNPVYLECCNKLYNVMKFTLSLHLAMLSEQKFHGYIMNIIMCRAQTHALFMNTQVGGQLIYALQRCTK